MTEPSYLGATRVAYDVVAADYAAKFDSVADLIIDRALFQAFAELVNAGGAGQVADLGCGPGYITAHLSSLGLNVFGIDLSPQMVAVARRSHPSLRFEEGSMTALDLPDQSLGGITALYSTIHIPHEKLPALFAEFRRVLSPGGQVLVAFQVGEPEQRTRTEAFGHPITLTYYLRPAELVAEAMTQGGLTVHARLIREPDGITESVPRAYLLARA